ncbi:hypothetical protein AB0J83_42075 [Actinoplanes sp. NPDC049596]|uniref:hypothetical protein n=1 Tax=unclassified Actinoplanes TaxID=2626549 RepID=UPI00343369D4
MQSRLRLGPAGADAAARFAAELSTAQRRHDLRAAAVAATALGADDGNAYLRLAELARGTGTTDVAATVDTREPPTVAISDVAALLRDTEAHTRMMLLEFRVDGLTLWAADRSSGELDPRWQAPWSEVCRQLPGYRQKQLFQLAGGVGDAPVRRAEWVRTVTAAIDTIAPLADAPLVVVGAPPQWQLLTDAQHLAVSKLHPAATVPAAGDRTRLTRFAHAVMATVPRPEGYDVVVCRVDARTGVAAPQRQTVLPPEVVDASRPREAQIAVYGSGQGDAVVVPLIRAGADLTDPAAAVSTAVLKLAAGERGVLTVRQEEPGRVELLHSGAAPHPPAWADLVGDLETLCQVGPGTPVDVVITIELGESRIAAGTVSARLATAQRLITEMTGLAHGALRVGVVGYGDHDPRDGIVEMRTAPLGDPDLALDALIDMAAEPAHNDLAAPLEDALDVVADMSWRRAARKVLLVLAGRPPHPPVQRMYLAACPARLRLPAVVSTLPDGLTVVPVLSGPAVGPDSSFGRAGREWSDEAWPMLTGRLPVMSVESYPELIAELLNPRGNRQRLRLALSEPLPS